MNHPNPHDPEPDATLPPDSSRHDEPTGEIPAGAKFHEGWWYVYRLRSRRDPGFGYTGVTRNLRRRLQQHNRGANPSTARYSPFTIVFAAAFPAKLRALQFESYLKSGSGHAFASRRLW
jgi:putative endonuclease